MKTFLCIILLSAITASSALATAQFPDKIVYKGNQYDLLSNPMESYFKKNPDKRPHGAMCSALWRGYVATFEIKDKDLVLTDIQIMDASENDITFKSVKDTFLTKGEPLKLDWFSGILVIPSGNLVNYVHMGYGSTYSGYILLEIKNGKLTGERTYNQEQYEKFKEKQFQAYKKTEAYRKQVEELKNKTGTQESLDSFLRSFVVEYTSEFLDEGSPSKEPNTPATKTEAPSTK